MSDYDSQSDDPESSVDFDDLLTGWSDEARPPYKSSEDVASAASSTPPLLGPSNPSPHEWLTENERQDNIAQAQFRCERKHDDPARIGDGDIAGGADQALAVNIYGRFLVAHYDLLFGALKAAGTL